jgi:hypothetical protein
MNRHPTTSGSSHLLEGVSLGVSAQKRIAKRWNYRHFGADFESVSRSKLNQNVMNLSVISLEVIVTFASP